MIVLHTNWQEFWLHKEEHNPWTIAVELCQCSQYKEDKAVELCQCSEWSKEETIAVELCPCSQYKEETIELCQCSQYKEETIELCQCSQYKEDYSCRTVSMQWVK